MTRFIIADDHPLFREAICQVVRNSHSGAEIVEADDILSLQKCVADHPDADLILLDLHMPGAYGFGALAFIRGSCPDIPVLVISANEKPSVMAKAIHYGARGFLPKSSSIQEIETAIGTVLSGESWLPESARNETAEGSIEEDKLVAGIASLTPQQYLVLTMLAQGLLNKQIAYELNVTEATIKAHMTAIFRKLGVRSRTQTALAISKLELEPPQDQFA
ncbi:MAG: response regulator [bacterium]